MSIVQSTPEAVIDYFHNQTHEREPHAEPDNQLDKFEDGIAQFQPGLSGVVDEAASMLITNYRSPLAVGNIVIPSVLGGDEFSERVQEQLKLTPVVFIATHPSIASPDLVARKLNTTEFDPDIAKRIYTVAGPRPMTLTYPLGPELALSPYLMGVALGNIALIGPNSGSVDTAPEEVKDWLKATGNTFKANLDMITERNEDGMHNAIIICPSGRIAKRSGTEAIEYRERSTRYLEAIADRVVFWPVGVYDELMVDPKRPSSLVGIQPNGSPLQATNEDEIFTIHQIAVNLSHFAFGGMRMQSALSARSEHGRVISGNVWRWATSKISQRVD